MREGFSTGSCAAAAALASCLWQRDGECPPRVEIMLPCGRSYAPEILAREPYCCAVVKDAGDDPDITNGCELRVSVQLDADPNTDSCADTDKGEIRFCAGEGVGTITLPGLKLPVGAAAINPAPREMIEKAVRSVYGKRGAEVTVSIPGGKELAARSFNPRLGIVGGLSVLGTSGLVRPMSDDALTATIALSLSVVRAQGEKEVALVFGNQGEEIMQKRYPGKATVQMSNFVGFALDEAERQGFERIIIGGHPGKLSKVAAGVMQTHSRYGDARRESVVARLALMGAEREWLERVMAAITTDAILEILRDSPYEGVWDKLAAAARQYCLLRVRRPVALELLIWDGEGRILGRAVEEE